MPQWTEEQLQAIRTRGGNILVSAAAGSGKTAVLSARVTEFVEQGGDLDRLLIVTFTRPAAAEMRTRIARDLAALAAQQPQNAHLRRQSLLLYKAKISTIDSFGMDLLRRNFQTADLAPDFTVMDGAEEDSLRAAALQQQIEEYYTEFPQGFEAFLHLFGGDTDGKNIEAILSEVARKLQSLPFGDLWTERQKARLEGTDHWIGALCTLLLPTVEAYEELFEEVVTAAPYAAAGMASVQSDKDFLTRVRQGLQDADWDRVCEIVTGYKFPTAARITKNPTDVEEIYREYRKKMKDFFQKEVFTLTTETCRSDLDDLRPAMIFLMDAVREHRRRVLEEMRRRNAYGFSQLSDLALNLLVENYSYEDGSFTPSPIALREREEYDEILIDEYQDTNDLQDLMFRAVSRDNCFAVGDVKQGIYGFRGANPANFLRKKDDSKVIVLNRNFRSRAGILDYANFLFRGLFSPLLGGIVYDESEALIPGRSADEGNPYPARHGATLLPTQDFPPPREREGREPDTELLLLPCESKTDEDCALLCAKLIRDALDGGATVFDKGEKAVRPLRYSDVAILLRSTKNAVEIYEEVFRTCGIPLLSSEGQTFLDTPEVCGVLAFLRTVNDPWDNVALFVTLTGNLFSLTPDQVANLRLRAPKSYLWEGLCAAAEEDDGARNVLRQINRFRILAQNLPIPKLLWEIYTATDYLALESATDPMARSNLMKFYSFACRYSGSGGLCGFLEFADRARRSGKVREAGSAPDGDFVRIMTIHKSKGLEFAWCILPELEHKLGGVRDKISVDTQFGIAPKLKNPAETAEYTTLMRETLELKQEQESISEELRVLYVGLTRARDRMTLISRTNADPDKMLAHAYHTKNGAVRLPTLLGAQNYAQMILDRTANHPDAKVLHSISPEEATLPLRVSYVGVPEAVSPVTEGKKTECGLSPEDLSARFEYRYDDHLSAVPAKVSVTEIAKVPADPDSALLLEEPPVTKPKFLDETTLTATERGTALHTFCQFAEFDRPVEDEIRRLTERGHLTEAEAATLDRAAITGFLGSDLMQTLRSSLGYRREVRFVCRIPVSYYSGNPAHEGEMLMQGAIDLLCETEEGYWIVDFKSDRATPRQLIDRYARQINLYAAAVRRLYDKPVLGCKLWSFANNCSVDVPEGEL